MQAQPPVPTLQQLGKSFLIALAIAAVLLVTAVLPAEYGIDPLGAGKALGLDKLAAAPTTDNEVIPDAASATGEQQTASASPVVPLMSVFQNQEKSIVLEPYDGIELKAAMNAGDRFVFDWNTDGAALYTDMHGEKYNAGDEFTSYWKVKEQQQAKGAFTAPFDGTHGWYWQNMTDEPITIHVKVSGFFEKLYTP